MENLGNITVSPNVIKDIVIETLKDIENVCGIHSSSKTDLTSFFKSNDKKSLEVEVGETECVIELTLALVYGCNIQEVAKTVQNEVANKVKELAGIDVREVNITVDKIIKKEKEGIEEEIDV